MIVLKQVIHDVPTNAVEATWVDVQPLPDQIIPEVPATPDLFDADGNLVQTGAPAIPEQVIANRTEEVKVRCHSYADRQMQLFRDHAAIAGTPLTEYEALIALVESNIQPIHPPTAEEIAAEAQQEADEQARDAAKADATIKYLVSHTPAECYAKVQSDVNTLAEAKVMLGRLAMALSVLARRELR